MVYHEPKIQGERPVAVDTGESVGQRLPSVSLHGLGLVGPIGLIGPILGLLPLACSVPVAGLLPRANGASSSGTTVGLGSTTSGSAGTSGSSPTSATTGGGSGPGGTAAGGNGGGCPALFAAAVQIVTGVGPNADPRFQPADPWGHSLAVGDLNGDGIPDLAVGYLGNPPSDFGILLGNGDGSFQPAIHIDAGGQPVAARIGRFGQDDTNRLAVADAWTQTVGIFQLSAGTMINTGTFQSPLGCRFVDDAYLSVSDFNHDGWPDILLGSDSEGVCDSSVAVLLGPDGGSSGWSSTTAAVPAAVGDFDGDGIPDLVFATFPTSGLQFLRGRGDGTFDDPVAIGSDAFVAVAGDLNGDGILDLLTIPFGGYGMTLLVGNGDGTFSIDTYDTLSPISAVGFPGFVDINRDGHLDLVGTDWRTNLVHVALGNGDGTFQSEIFLRIADTRPGALATWVSIADLNGDGWPDLIVGDYFDGNVSVFLNNGCH